MLPGLVPYPCLNHLAPIRPGGATAEPAAHFPLSSPGPPLGLTTPALPPSRIPQDAYRRAVDVSPQDFRAWYGLVSLVRIVWHLDADLIAGYAKANDVTF